MPETAAPAVPVAPVLVQSPLTVIMTIKSPEDYEALNATLQGFNAMPPDQNPVIQALNSVGTVHFARFVFLDNNTKLGIITTFDGSFEKYIRDFAEKLGPIFDMIHVHMIDSPPLPVKEHPDEFLQYVRDHDVTPVAFYSAYPSLTVLDIKNLQ
ncbi:hypothetical protein CCAX7_31380 [Capsulimonas corticalis]|uniref:Uncharacterized protein n=1 Tax=Capsulimonas corticalis TaxID=2219043 RepID=A0A402CSG4_9BACT|nr:hypothetical protein [Capsulimonas corticalis]BDI31087.1 hypothetical protein CCAX7_31380 [Capsulimonas corticalis]